MIYSKKYMKKKIVKSKKLKARKGPTLMDKLPKNHGEWLMLCMKFTKRAIDQSRDTSMTGQYDRLSTQLKEWKALNPGAVLRNL